MISITFQSDNCELRNHDRMDEINQLLTKHVFHDNYTNGSYARVKMCETNIDPCYNLQVCYLFKTLKNTKFTTLWVQRNFETIDLHASENNYLLHGDIYRSLPITIELAQFLSRFKPPLIIKKL